MDLSKEEAEFIKENSKILEAIFSRRLDWTLEKISELPSGKERDIKIEFWREYKSWLNSIGMIKENPKEVNRDFI